VNRTDLTHCANSVFGLGLLVQFEAAGDGLNCHVELAYRQGRRAQTFISGGQVGAQRNGRLEMRNGLTGVALRHQRRAETMMGFGMFGLKRQGLPIGGGRRLPAALLGEHIGQIDAPLRRSWD